MINILVLEDDFKLNKLFSTIINRNGFNALSALNANEALDFFNTHNIDLIVTDIMLPGINGYEFIETIRKSNKELPILMLTAKDDLSSKKRAFELGSDDYMVKPIDTDELILRINALLRRANIATTKKITINNTILDYDTFIIKNNDKEIFIPQKEFKILYKLASYPNKIFTRQQLMDDIWGYDSESDERTVDVHINRLRDRLKDFPDILLITVRGLGYKVGKL